MTKTTTITDTATAVDACRQLSLHADAGRMVGFVWQTPYRSAPRSPHPAAGQFRACHSDGGFRRVFCADGVAGAWPSALRMGLPPAEGVPTVQLGLWRTTSPFGF